MEYIFWFSFITYNTVILWLLVTSCKLIDRVSRLEKDLDKTKTKMVLKG